MLGSKTSRMFPDNKLGVYYAIRRLFLNFSSLKCCMIKINKKLYEKKGVHIYKTNILGKFDFFFYCSNLQRKNRRDLKFSLIYCYLF